MTRTSHGWPRRGNPYAPAGFRSAGGLAAVAVVLMRLGRRKDVGEMHRGPAWFTLRDRFAGTPTRNDESAELVRCHHAAV
jgi:hypothetical protein